VPGFSLKIGGKGGLPVKYSVGRLTGFALLLWLFVAAQQQAAFAQSGSTGGVIGKTDKSVSGGEGAARRPIEGGASDRVSRISLTGQWRWNADCSGFGRYSGVFNLVETSRGHFNGNFAGTSSDDIGKITDGVIDGSNISFTRTTLVVQYWKGELIAGRLKGSLSGNANCSWEASRK
jgi:hypothetical protein